MSILLSADIGGTKTILQLNDYQAGQISLVKRHIYKSNEWPDFNDLLLDFLDSAPCAPYYDSACLAIAGPIIQNNHNTTSNVTNLPWIIDKNALQQTYNIKNLSLINDFQAVAYSVDQLAEDDFITLQTGTPVKHAPRAFIGAGTGLGQAIAIHDGLEYQVISTEGGHCDFAATNDFEVALYQYLNQKYSHVSYERLLSGEGLNNIYQFFTQICDPVHQDIAETRYIETQADRAKAIAVQAAINPEGLAARSLSLFFKIYGAQAGNLALSCLPTAGLYIAGGIAQKNIKQIQTSDFLSAFQAKGRMQPLLEKIPLKLITREDAGLLGALHIAIRQIQQH